MCAQYGITIVDTNVVPVKLNLEYGDPNDIQEDYAESKIKMQEAAKEDVVETIVDFDQYHHTEDEYSEFKFSDYMYQITLWTIGIIVSVIIIYIIFNNV